MSKSGMNRRQFLVSGGRTVIGSAALSLDAPNARGAEPTAVPDQSTIDTLVAVARRLYPHERHSDAPYRACVEGLEEKAEQNKTILTTLIEGIRQIDVAAAPSRFIDLSKEAQHRVLKEYEGSEFFEIVKNQVVVALYKDKQVWAKLGYEGSSYEFGGYLERGFNDIDWLPKS
ncbi:MAG: hypothetical protein HQ511_13945 [Rhodospirillales bacterium]|nr:hypothetical protein [Rhodospirillales bacterium]